MTNFAVQNLIARERILLFETLILSGDQPPYSIWDIFRDVLFFFALYLPAPRKSMTKSYIVESLSNPCIKIEIANTSIKSYIFTSPKGSLP